MELFDHSYLQRAALKEERIRKLVDELQRKLSIFTESATGIDDVDVTRSWRTICELDAEYDVLILARLSIFIYCLPHHRQLKSESYGVELLQAIGFVYAQKARYA